MAAWQIRPASPLILTMIKCQVFYLAAKLTQNLSLLKKNFLLMHLAAKMLLGAHRPECDKKPKLHALIILVCGFIQLNLPSIVQAEALPEYRVKAAFLYNFANYTQWPDDIGNNFNICIYGEHSFGDELQQMQEKKINQRDILINYTTQIESLAICQIVFISHSSTFAIKAILDHLKDKPVLKVTDNLNKIHDGTTINLVVTGGKIKFDVDLAAAQSSGLNLSSQLLRFAREVYK